MSVLLNFLRSKTVVAIAFMIGLAFPREIFACYPPEVPSCFSSQGLVSGRPDFHFCRAQVEKYQNDANQYIRCLGDEVNRTGQRLNDAARDYERKKNEYEQAAEYYNQANASYQNMRAVYERNLATVQQTMDAIIRNFNAMFGQ